MLAQKQKLDPDLLDRRQKKTLPLLALPEYIDIDAKYGYARGGMPVAFVDRVRAYYDILLVQQPAVAAAIADVLGQPPMTNSGAADGTSAKHAVAQLRRTAARDLLSRTADSSASPRNEARCSGHVRLQHFGHIDAAVGALVILHHRDQSTTDGETRVR